jgi:hypothetical protein
VCSLAYFHDVLVGDGNATSSSAEEGVYVAKTELPLWQAIEMAKSYTYVRLCSPLLVQVVHMDRVSIDFVN